jgi:hypothetical protein
MASSSFVAVVVAVVLIGCFGGPVVASAAATNFTQSLDLVDPIIGAAFHFGDRVAAWGQLLVVSAPTQTVNGYTNVGLAFAYWCSSSIVENESYNCSYISTLSSLPSVVAGEYFGSNMAVSASYTVAVGAPTYTYVSGKLGVVFLFSCNETACSEQGAALTAADEANSDRFGYSLAWDGDILLVSAAFKNQYGYLYLFSCPQSCCQGLSWQCSGAGGFVGRGRRAQSQQLFWRCIFVQLYKLHQLLNVISTQPHQRRSQR